MAAMLESLLADNVRLNGENGELVVACDELRAVVETMADSAIARDERIAALEKALRGVRWYVERCLRESGSDVNKNNLAAIDDALNPAGQCSGTATGESEL
jgi:hypothetical protein